MVALEGLNDVVPRFHTIGLNNNAKNYFYDFEFGKNIILKDSIFDIVYDFEDELFKEVDTRWKLVSQHLK